jgi:hypothetical protein
MFRRAHIKNKKEKKRKLICAFMNLFFQREQKEELARAYGQSGKCPLVKKKEKEKEKEKGP